MFGTNISALTTIHAFFLFFFSSRRRHTRLVSDWSSDVCSSDLERAARYLVNPLSTRYRAARSGSSAHRLLAFRIARIARLVATGCFFTKSRFPRIMQQKYCEIGRASCRERGEIPVDAITEERIA